jgi:hemerythrin-like domain-containing protein
MSKAWADQPFALISETGIRARTDIPAGHAAVNYAHKMALLHNMIIRGLNALYNQCLGVQTDTTDAHDFLVFGQVFYETLHGHHQLEEILFFPELEKITGEKGLMDGNVQQHKDFEESLEQFREYVFKTNADAYDGMELKAILDNLGPILEKHLHEEIKTLLDLAVYDSQKLQDLWGRCEKTAHESHDKYRYDTLIIPVHHLQPSCVGKGSFISPFAK